MPWIYGGCLIVNVLVMNEIVFSDRCDFGRIEVLDVFGGGVLSIRDGPMLIFIASQ